MFFAPLVMNAWEVLFLTILTFTFSFIRLCKLQLFSSTSFSLIICFFEPLTLFGSYNNQMQTPPYLEIYMKIDFAKIQFRKHSFWCSKNTESSFSWRSRFQLENFLEMNSCRNSVLLFSLVISIISMWVFWVSTSIYIDSKSWPIPHSCLVFLHLIIDSLF